MNMTVQQKADVYLEQFEEYMTAEKVMTIQPFNIRAAWAQGYLAALDDIVKRDMRNMRQVYGFIHEVTGNEPEELEPIDGREL